MWNLRTQRKWRKDMLAGAGCLKSQFLFVQHCTEAVKKVNFHVKKDPFLCINEELWAVTSNPHLAVLPIFDFIHQDQPIWICRLQPLQVDGIFLFCFPWYRSWNVICSLCEIFTGDVRRTSMTETGTLARVEENGRFMIFFRCRSSAARAIQAQGTNSTDQGPAGELNYWFPENQCRAYSSTSNELRVPKPPVYQHLILPSQLSPTPKQCRELFPPNGCKQL